MRKLLYSILIAASVTACSQRPDSNDRLLAAADAALSEHPDSTLSIIQSIDPRSLSRGQTALMALLTAKACNKASLPQPADSLLSLAVNQFRWQGDSIEVQALYYRGLGQSQRGELIEALYSLHEAYDKAITSSNHFYAAMSAREICSVYSRLLIPKKETEWAVLAKELFKKAGKPVHASWMDDMIARGMIRQGDATEALDLIDNVDSATVSDSRSLRHRIIIQKIYALTDIGRFNEITPLYIYLCKDGYKMKAHDHIRLADVMLHNNDISAAESALAMALDSHMTSADSLYYSWIKSKVLNLQGNNTAAYKELQQMSSKLLSTDSKMITDPAAMYIADRYKLEYEVQLLEKQKKDNIILMLSIISALILCVTIIIIILYRERIRRKSSEIRKRVAEAENLKDNITLLKKAVEEYRLMALSVKENHDTPPAIEKESDTPVPSTSEDIAYDNAISNQTVCTHDSKTDFVEEINELPAMQTIEKSAETILMKEIRPLLCKQVALVNRICSGYYTKISNSHPSKENKEIASTIAIFKEFLNDDTGETITDNFCSHWLNCLTSTCSHLTAHELTLAKYLLLGLKPEAIAILMGKSSTQLIHAAKTKLKTKILKTENADTQLLTELGMKH